MWTQLLQVITCFTHLCDNIKPDAENKSEHSKNIIDLLK